MDTIQIIHLEKGKIDFNKLSCQSIILSSYCELIETANTVVPGLKQAPNLKQA